MNVSAHHHANCLLLMLIDNMSVCLAFERRRSKNLRVLACIRRVSAISFLLGLRVSYRWVASEANSSDRPSRHVDPVDTTAVTDKPDLLDYADVVSFVAVVQERRRGGRPWRPRDPHCSLPSTQYLKRFKVFSKN